MFGKSFLNKGFGHYFIDVSTTFVFNKYKKNKFTCGINNKNIPSIKAFQKAGFKKTKMTKKNRENNSRTYVLNI